MLEGIDGSGRSTHVRLLEDALRYRGYAVTRTSIGASAIAGEPIRRAKSDRTSGPVETTLLYAADIAERVEQQIMPSLGAGLIVLADRYVYTPVARAEARGLDRSWLEAVFRFAVPPDAVLFLDVDPATAIPRRGDPTAASKDSRRIFVCRPRQATAIASSRNGSIRASTSRPTATAFSALSARAPLATWNDVWNARCSRSSVNASRPRVVGPESDALLHLSDFHFDGSRELARSLTRMVDVGKGLRPDVVVVTGDLSANGQPDELAAVAQELDRFGSVPRFVLPGNRDLEASVGAPGEALRIPVESDLDYFLALEPALNFEFADEAARRGKPAEFDMDRPHRRAGTGDEARRGADRGGEFDAADPHGVARARRATTASRPHERVARPRPAPWIAARSGSKLREGDVTSRAGDILALLCDLRVDLVLHGHIHRAHVWQISDGRHAIVVASAGALVNDGRRDASFLEIVADDSTLRINRRSVATGAPTALYEGTRRSSRNV